MSGSHEVFWDTGFDVPIRMTLSLITIAKDIDCGVQFTKKILGEIFLWEVHNAWYC